ncbi:MAG: hypothetical protein U0169_06595 [Polyangiaceae bacterium]
MPIPSHVRVRRGDSSFRFRTRVATGLALLVAGSGACSAPDPNLLIDLEDRPRSPRDGGVDADGGQVTNVPAGATDSGTTVVTNPTNPTLPGSPDAGAGADAGSNPSNPGNPTADAGTPPANVVVTSFAPAQVLAGSNAINLGVSGQNFAPGCVVMFSSTVLTSNFGSQTSMSAVVPANLLATVGSIPVSVRCGAQTVSASTFFQVIPAQSPSHTVQSFTPTTVQAGATQFGITVSGANFTPNCVVLFGADTLTTGFQSSAALNAVVPASLVANASSLPVSVQCGDRTISAASFFQITAPPVSVTTFSPSSVTAGSGTFGISVGGSGFNAGCSVLFGNAAVTTTFQDATSLVGAIPATSVSTAGNFAVGVRCNNTNTNAANFFTVVSAPTVVTPSVASVTPTSVALGSTFTLTVRGSGFVAGQSRVLWGSTVILANVTNSAQLAVTVSAVNTSTAGVRLVRVQNVNGTAVATSPTGANVNVVAIRAF